jgi:hypothetical protein
VRSALFACDGPLSNWQTYKLQYGDPDDPQRLRPVDRERRLCLSRHGEPHRRELRAPRIPPPPDAGIKVVSELDFQRRIAEGWELIPDT